MTLANSIFVDSELTFKQQYLEIVHDLVKVIDFQANNASDIINAWCAENTNGLIDEVMDDVADMVLAAVNAVYLNASWVHQFDAQYTFRGSFFENKANNAAVISDEVAFMHQIE